MMFQKYIPLIALTAPLVFSGCGGGSSSNAAKDTVPDAFNINLPDRLAVSSVIESDSITITGINSATEISIDGGEYSVDGGAFTSANGEINNNQSLKIRVTTPDSNDVSVSVTVTIGGISATITALTEVYAGQLLFSNSGPDLIMYGLVDGKLSERDRVTIPNVAHSIYSIFSITKHPTANIIFTTATNDCRYGEIACWGNGQIDAYEYDSNGITHLTTSYRMVAPLKVQSFDDGSKMTITLSNQKPGDFTISSLNTDGIDLETMPFFTDCIDTTLTGSASCTITYTHSGEFPDVNITVNTDMFNYDIYVEEASFESQDETTYYAYDPTILNSETAGGIEECATYNSDYIEQYGHCAPTALAITKDGTRAYINEDENDTVVAVDIASDYTMTFAFESGEISYQGIAVSPDGSTLYAGTEALSIEQDSLINMDSGTGGNATEVITTDDQTLLITTVYNERLSISDITTDYTSPLELGLVTVEDPAYSDDISSGHLNYQAHNSDLTTFVTAGFPRRTKDSSQVTVFSFDTAALEGEYSGLPFTLESTLMLDHLSDEICPPDGEGEMMIKAAAVVEEVDCNVSAFARSIALNDSGDSGVVASFIYSTSDEPTVSHKGVITAFSIGDDYAINKTATIELENYSRTVLFVETP